MNDIKVYKMNDYEWWVSNLGKKETNEWYKKEHGLTDEDNPLEEIVECDLDEEGMWWLTDDPRDLEKIVDKNDLVTCKIVNGRQVRNAQFGDLMKIDGEVYKFISFREAIQRVGSYKEPCMIAALEW